MIISGALFVGEAVDSAHLKSPIYLQNLRCDGSEDTLLDCDASPIGTRDETCSHKRDVHIRCEGEDNLYVLIKVKITHYKRTFNSNAVVVMYML